MAITNICVLIPSYNEAGTIGGIVRGLKDRGLTVYVIDDGSTDETASIAKARGAVVVQHKKNKGKGASLREGFTHIMKKTFDYVLVMDADNQHELEDAASLILEAERSGADMVIGNRMGDTSSMPFVRTIVNRFMSSVISLVARQRIPDTQCGFRLINLEVLKQVELRSSNYEIESELIIKASRRGFKISSVPIKTIYQDETSKVNPIVDTIRFLIFIIKAVFTR